MKNLKYSGRILMPGPIISTQHKVVALQNPKNSGVRFGFPATITLFRPHVNDASGSASGHGPIPFLNFDPPSTIKAGPSVFTFNNTQALSNTQNCLKNLILD
jgi:hypothetical protein